MCGLGTLIYSVMRLIKKVLIRWKVVFVWSGSVPCFLLVFENKNKALCKLWYQLMY